MVSAFFSVRLDCKLFGWKHANSDSGEQRERETLKAASHILNNLFGDAQFNGHHPSFLIFRFSLECVGCLIGDQQFAEVVSYQFGSTKRATLCDIERLNGGRALFDLCCDLASRAI